MQSPLMRLIDVYRHFQMGEVVVQVLNGMTFDISEGEFLAIVGPSGSGKTTVLNLIGGLDQPSSGQLWYRDQELSSATPSQLNVFRREQVGFVFQLYNLVPNLTAYENVTVSIEIAPNPIDADEALKLVGLYDRRDHFPSQLSGGEQQRVAIARAIAKNPSLLLCDEPTGALDYKTGKQVLQLLVDLNERLQTTVVMITHNSALAKVAHRVIHLRSGEISEMVENPSPVKPAEVVW